MIRPLESPVQNMIGLADGVIIPVECPSDYASQSTCYNRNLNGEWYTYKAALVD